MLIFYSVIRIAIFQVTMETIVLVFNSLHANTSRWHANSTCCLFSKCRPTEFHLNVALF